MDKKIVLIVEDHKMVRGLVVTILENSGFSVLAAASGPEAIQIFRERSQDIGCVLQDLSMPNMSGEEAIAELRQINSDIPILVYSAHEESAVSYRLDKFNTAGYLQKPFSPEILVEQISKLLQVEFC